MSPVSPWDDPKVEKSSIAFRHREVDFITEVKFRPRFCIEVKPDNYTSGLTRRLLVEARRWLTETLGPEGTDWKIALGTEQFYFKDKNNLVLFKLMFGGFDKI